MEQRKNGNTGQGSTSVLHRYGKMIYEKTEKRKNGTARYLHDILQNGPDPISVISAQPAKASQLSSDSSAQTAQLFTIYYIFHAMYYKLYPIYCIRHRASGTRSVSDPPLLLSEIFSDLELSVLLF